MTGRGDADGQKVVTLARLREARAPAPVPARGQPVAFGVELPARGDIVFSVAALTQLVTIADQAGLEASADLKSAIGALTRRLQAHGIALPPALEAMVEDLDLGASAGVHLLSEPRG